MSALSEFETLVDLTKGRKPAPVGTLSKDGKNRKAADGTWKPIKKQREGKPKPSKAKYSLSYFDEESDKWVVKKFSTKREAVDALNHYGGELTGGGVRTKKAPPPKFFEGPGSRHVEYAEVFLKRNQELLARMKSKGYVPTMDFGRRVASKEELQEIIKRAEADLKRVKKEIKLATLAEGVFQRLKTVANKIPSQLHIEHSFPGRIAFTGNSGNAKYVEAKARDTVDGLFERAMTFISRNYYEPES